MLQSKIQIVHRNQSSIQAGSFINVSNAIGAGNAEGAAAFLAKLVWAKLIRFGQIWLDFGEIWANVIRFGQNQNLAS